MKTLHIAGLMTATLLYLTAPTYSASKDGGPKKWTPNHIRSEWFFSAGINAETKGNVNSYIGIDKELAKKIGGEWPDYKLTPKLDLELRLSIPVAKQSIESSTIKETEISGNITTITEIHNEFATNPLKADLCLWYTPPIYTPIGIPRFGPLIGVSFSDGYYNEFTKTTTVENGNVSTDETKSDNKPLKNNFIYAGGRFMLSVPFDVLKYKEKDINDQFISWDVLYFECAFPIKTIGTHTGPDYERSKFILGTQVSINLFQKPHSPDPIKTFRQIMRQQRRTDNCWQRQHR
ncbi:MAG: hypothetical protein ACP5N3_00540 [Candidatus Nanoarchaeia archaeon]